MIRKLFLYPIKSTQAYQVNQAIVQEKGLNFDRTFMLTETNGKFITARKHAELFNFSAFPQEFGLFIQHSSGEQISIYYRDFQQQSVCEVWGNQFSSFVAPQHINQWFSEKLKQNVQLRWLGEQSQRTIKKYPNSLISFVDGYPILLTNIQSLTAIQALCPTRIKMSQFRPNIVIDFMPAFAEEQWSKIKIGNVTFLITQSCTRCVLTARDPNTGKNDEKLEPFRTLKKHHCNEKGEPIFGVYLLPLNTGVIRVGDPIECIPHF